MKLGIRSKLFLIALGLIVVSVVLVFVYARAELRRELSLQIQSDLEQRAELVALHASALDVSLEDWKSWDVITRELAQRARARVTLVRSDGVVLGDSEVSLAETEKLDNHAGRPEVVGALQKGSGHSRRYSTTIENDLLYVAVPFHRNDRVVGVARLAMPLTQVNQAIAQLRAVLTAATILALAVAVIMSSIAAHLASRTARALTHSAQRMAAGDLSTRTRLQGEDEFGELGRSLDQLAQRFAGTLDELKSERDRIAGTLSSMQEGVLMLDQAGRVALVNPALREMLLLGPDCVGKTPLEVIRHAELKELLDRGQRSLEPQSREIELSGLKPRRLLVRVARLTGEERGVFAIFFDVTEMRRLESMRRDFVANVSHELRTPVTAIRSAAETLQGALTREPKDAQQFVAIIERNAERLQGLVEDLLDLSRIESREFRLNLEALDVRQVYVQVTSLFAERASKKEVRLGEAASGEIPLVRADRKALEHVITNLVDNAVKYCGRGCEVRLGGSDAGDSVRLVVEDTGPGIEERHLPRIFERFYRVDAGRSRDVGGTGLGLSIVKHLVESMGGKVSAESAPGRGCRFSFTLPKATASEQGALPSRPNAASERRAG